MCLTPKECSSVRKTEVGERSPSLFACARMDGSEIGSKRGSASARANGGDYDTRNSSDSKAPTDNIYTSFSDDFDFASARRVSASDLKSQVTNWSHNEGSPIIELPENLHQEVSALIQSMSLDSWAPTQELKGPRDHSDHRQMREQNRTHQVQPPACSSSHADVVEAAVSHALGDAVSHALTRALHVQAVKPKPWQMPTAEKIQGGAQEQKEKAPPLTQPLPQSLPLPPNAWQSLRALKGRKLASSGPDIDPTPYDPNFRCAPDFGNATIKATMPVAFIPSAILSAVASAVPSALASVDSALHSVASAAPTSPNTLSGFSDPRGHQPSTPYRTSPSSPSPFNVLRRLDDQRRIALHWPQSAELVALKHFDAFDCLNVIAKVTRLHKLLTLEKPWATPALLSTLNLFQTFVPSDRAMPSNLVRLSLIKDDSKLPIQIFRETETALILNAPTMLEYIRLINILPQFQDELDCSKRQSLNFVVPMPAEGMAISRSFAQAAALEVAASAARIRSCFASIQGQPIRTSFLNKFHAVLVQTFSQSLDLHPNLCQNLGSDFASKQKEFLRGLSPSQLRLASDLNQCSNPCRNQFFPNSSDSFFSNGSSASTCDTASAGTHFASTISKSTSPSSSSPKSPCLSINSPDASPGEREIFGKGVPLGSGLWTFNACVETNDHVTVIENTMFVAGPHILSLLNSVKSNSTSATLDVVHYDAAEARVAGTQTALAILTSADLSVSSR